MMELQTRTNSLTPMMKTLVGAGLLSNEQAMEAHNLASREDVSFTTVLVRDGLISSRRLADT